MLSVSLRPFCLPLVRPLSTAHGLIEVREGLVIEARDGEGRTGFGEFAPLLAFGTESLQVGRALLHRAVAKLAGLEAPDGLESVASLLEAGALPATAPASRSGLEQALLDLLSRRRGQPLFRLLAEALAAPDPDSRVPVSALLSQRSPAALAVEAGAARQGGCAAVKLKIAHAPLAEDLARVRAVRGAIGEACALRLDANGGFTAEGAAAALAAFSPSAPQYCEQPLPPGQPPAAWKELARLCPLAADESAAHPAELAALLACGALAAVVLKPAPLGGLLSAGRLGLRARSAGAEPVVSTGLDGAIGRAGAAHLAAALGARLPAGLGTGTLVVEEPGQDPAPPVGFAIALSEEPGLGRPR